MGAFLHTSNCLNRLAGELAHLLSQPSVSPLQKEVVVVPSLGLRRWLTLQVAAVSGVCANIDFPFVAEFISSLPATMTGKAISQRMPAALMVWAIHRLLPDLLDRKEFAPVADYLSDSDPLKRFQLCQRIAQLFDQYAVFRPEMVASWSNPKSRVKKDEEWQAALWSELSNDQSMSAARDRVVEETELNHNGNLPERVFVFGPTTLPPVYLRIFFELARTRELHLFLLQPSSEYHGDDLTPKQRARRNIAGPVTGNPLLTSLGRQSTHITELLLETDERIGPMLQELPSTFVPAAGETLLSALQSDILQAVNRGLPNNPPDGIGTLSRFEVNGTDRSLQIHSCHSPMREVEVLYDQLLEAFANDPTLRPRDILVMTPEIEKYSPLIRAVFEYPEDAKRQIPYSISDRHPRSESIIIDTFLRLLDLVTGRCAAEEVFSFISSPVVADRFGFSVNDLSLIRKWIEESGIAWAVDASHRERLGLPATDLNTWRFGLDRLLLGYAMTGDNRTLFHEILPYDEVEGDGGEILGRFMSATENIFALVEHAQTPRSLNEWSKLLRSAVDALLESDDEENVRDLRFLRKSIAGLSDIEEVAGAAAVTFPVVRHHLISLLTAMEQKGHFLTGGVNFCALKPAQNIPARMIFLLGINDEVFPRRPQPPQFDLMSNWRLGDPNPREDDRSAFLETLLSAGDSLHLSYIGRSIVHNQPIPPSVVISELVEYLQQTCHFPNGVSAKDFLTIDHSLQAFSHRYFDPEGTGSRLFSYSQANAAAARAAVAVDGRTAQPFLVDRLSEPDEALRAISLVDLVRFLAGPAKYFLKARFGLQLKGFENCLPEDEPIELDNLKIYNIRQELLEEWIDTNRTDLKIFAARGKTPIGTLGELQLRSIDRVAATFSSAVRKRIGDGSKGEPIPIDLPLGRLSLNGRIENIYDDRIVHYRCAALNRRDRLRAWVDHLASCATGGGAPGTTLLIGMDSSLQWTRISNAKEILSDLCQLFWDGLTRALPFFPDSALAYVEAELAHAHNPLNKGRQVWNGGYDAPGERDQAENEKLFAGTDPLTDEFILLARRVWGPLLKHSQELAPT